MGSRSIARIAFFGATPPRHGVFRHENRGLATPTFPCVTMRPNASSIQRSELLSEEWHIRFRELQILWRAILEEDQKGSILLRQMQSLLASTEFK